MPLAAMSAILSIINKIVKDPQQQAQIAAQVQATFWQYQSDFISKTSDWATRLVRQAIVLAFAYALISPTWGRNLAANASAMPAYFWLILGWEFYGAGALQILPWFKNSMGMSVPATAIAGNDPIPAPVAIISPPSGGVAPLSGDTLASPPPDGGATPPDLSKAGDR